MNCYFEFVVNDYSAVAVDNYSYIVVGETAGLDKSEFVVDDDGLNSLIAVVVDVAAAAIVVDLKKDVVNQMSLMIDYYYYSNN